MNGQLLLCNLNMMAELLDKNEKQERQIDDKTQLLVVEFYKPIVKVSIFIPYFY